MTLTACLLEWERSRQEALTRILFSLKRSSLIINIQTWRHVKVGAADVGILGTCQYEKLLTTGQIQPGEFRVLEAKNNTEACIRSTERYPDTVFYALDTAPIDEVKAVSLSLL